jgi:hypothetical protein
MLALELAPSGTHELARLTWKQLGIAAALHVGLAFALLHNAWASPTTSVVGPSLVDAQGYGANGIANGDSLQLVWFMKWTPFALSHLHDPLVTTYQNAPTGANLMWDALMPVAGVILAPVTLLAGPIVAFNLLATLALALCGLAATACARRFVRGPISALVGGVAFQLSPFVVAQSQGHQSVVVAAALVPCVILLAMDVVVYQRRTALTGGLLLGTAAAAAFYTWEETMLSTALMGVLGIAVAAAIAPRAFRRAWTKGAACVAAAGAVAMLLAIPGLLIQFFGFMHLSGGRIRDPNVWVIDLQNLITPTSSQALVPRVALSASHGWTGDGFEWGGYLGIPLLVTICVVTIALRRRRDVRWLSAMLLIGVLLSLGPHLHVGGHDTRLPLPWLPLTHVPLLQDVLAARLAVFPALIGSLVLAIAVDVLIAKRLYVAATAVVAAVGVTLVPAPLPAQQVFIPAFFSDGPVKAIGEGAVVLVAPYATPLAPQPMIWQAASDMRFRMPEGYVSLSGPNGGYLESPPDTVTSTTMQAVEVGQKPSLDNNLRQAIRADLDRWMVRVVIVGPMTHEASMIRLFTDVLGRLPTDVGGVAVWWSVG